MTIVKVFLPQIVFYSTTRPANSSESISREYIYGKIIKNVENQNISVFITNVTSALKQNTPSVGIIINSINNDDDVVDDIERHSESNLLVDQLYFERGKDSGVLHLKSIRLPNFIPNTSTYKIQLILYDFPAFAQLSQSDDVSQPNLESNFDPVSALLFLLREQNANKIDRGDTSCPGEQQQRQAQKLLSKFVTLITLLSQKFPSLKKSVFFKHFLIWSSSLDKFTLKSGRAWTIVFDITAGIAIMLWLWQLADADEYLMKFTEVIVKQLQQLLDALKGSPVGLKLNMELNNFFLACFRYHVDLWATFLVIIAPLIKYLFVPLTILGCLGLSFQLTMLVDLLSIITLHVHCIYIYASILYRIEMVGLIALWRVVSGRRKNVLKDRIESYDYSNPQLYLSVMFFAAFLFLLPTILVYYVVFASLRFGFYCITYTLMTAHRKLLTFPLYELIKWCFGRHISANNFEVTLLNYSNMQNDRCNYMLTLFLIKPTKCILPTWIDLAKEDDVEVPSN